MTRVTLMFAIINAHFTRLKPAVKDKDKVRYSGSKKHHLARARGAQKKSLLGLPQDENYVDEANPGVYVLPTIAAGCVTRSKNKYYF